MTTSHRWPLALRVLALLIAVSALSAYVGVSGCVRRSQPDRMLPATKAAKVDLVAPRRQAPPGPAVQATGAAQAPQVQAPAAPPPPVFLPATKAAPVFLPATKAAPIHLQQPAQR